MNRREGNQRVLNLDIEEFRKRMLKFRFALGQLFLLYHKEFNL